MKKIITIAIISFILGGVVAFFIFKGKKEQLTNAQLLLANSTHQAFANIGFAEAQHLVRQYKPGTIPRANPDQSMGSVSNTQTVWFDIKTLAELLDEVENQIQGGDGVRLYFATYDDNYPGIDSRGAKQDYSNANTLVLVPTFTRIIGGKNYHWDIPNNGDSTKNIALLATAPDYQNKGELCPPPSNCNTIGATLLP